MGRQITLVLALAGLIGAAQAVGDDRRTGTTRPALRSMKYTSRTPPRAAVWQRELRDKLGALLRINDLRKADIPLNSKGLSSQDQPGYRLQEIEFNSTPGRRIKALLTVPAMAGQHYPAVVCIHGHGGNRHAVHDPGSIYKGFAAALAAKGVVTIAIDVGQHEVYEEGRTLMGERLWDLMRCVDYLESVPQVDRFRIGCAGLSLGGEMAMWLGAMDERIAASVSSGFLTVMDQMEQNHCMCWKFPGLRELVDFADIYSLTAPRALQCQNGLKEGVKMFTVALARKAIAEVGVIYRDHGQEGKAELVVHDGGHEIDLPTLMTFLSRHLRFGPHADQRDQDRARLIDHSDRAMKPRIAP